jgi:hypothetical protein
VSITPPAQPCPDAKPTLGASYCPATNTITADLAALQKLGAVGDIKQGVLVQGDNTAISVLVSRYVLASQHQRSLARRCRRQPAHRMPDRSGATQHGRRPPPSITMVAGDMDEAVAGLLNNGLAASDVNGNTVPAGFSRVMAFRSGLLDTDRSACYARFP